MLGLRRCRSDSIDSIVRAVMQNDRKPLLSLSKDSMTRNSMNVWMSSKLFTMKKRSSDR